MFPLWFCCALVGKALQLAGISGGIWSNLLRPNILFKPHLRPHPANIYGQEASCFPAPQATLSRDFAINLHEAGAEAGSSLPPASEARDKCKAFLYLPASTDRQAKQ